MAGKDSTRIELQVPLKRVWTAFRDPNLLTNALPGFIESVEILEGDGASAGSIRKLNLSDAVPHSRYLKEKIVTVDSETHTFVTVVLEGGSIGIDYSSTKAIFKFSEGPGDSTILDWEFEYVAIVADPPVAQAKEGTTRTLKAIEQYLVSNSELYA